MVVDGARVIVDDDDGAPEMIEGRLTAPGKDAASDAAEAWPKASMVGVAEVEDWPWESMTVNNNNDVLAEVKIMTESETTSPQEKMIQNGQEVEDDDSMAMRIPMATG